jgi:hypothetical protein
MRGRNLVAAVVLFVLAFPVSAQASIKIAGNAHDASVRVNAKGFATVFWTRAGGERGSAVVRPNGSTLYGKVAGGKDVSQPSSAVRLPMLVELRRMPNGRFVALQSWRRLKGGPVELRFSRWRGAPTRLPIRAACCKWRSEMVKGRATFHGKPVYGYSATPSGVPLDKFGRNVYIDFAKKDGVWRRTMGILTHRPTGKFSLWIRPYWRGRQYRARMIGPNWGRTLGPDAQGWTKSAL